MNSQCLRACSKYFNLSRAVHTTKSRPASVDPKFKELQRQFQVDDGVPIYLKRGGSDRLIFSFVALGVGLCFLDALNTVYKLIYPKPNN